MRGIKHRLNTAGQQTFKLAIADAGDSILDSGVFIQGGSFIPTPIPIPEATVTWAMLTVAVGGLWGRQRRGSGRNARRSVSR